MCYIGKCPLFEVRKMDADVLDSQKATPISRKTRSDKPDLTTSKDMTADSESDMEDEERSTSQSKKSSSGRSVNKRSSPVCIYTYKVNCLRRFYLSLYVHLLTLTK